MRHVPIPGDNLQSLHSLRVTDDIIEKDRTVLFDPRIITLSASLRLGAAALGAELSWMRAT